MVSHHWEIGLYSIPQIRGERWATHPPVGLQAANPFSGFAFSHDTRYFVLAERHRSRDTMGIYDARNNYTLLRVCVRSRHSRASIADVGQQHFPLPTTSLASFALSPRSEYIAVWENPLEYRLYILNLTGDVLSSFTPDPDPGQGIRCASWHPSGSMIAVGGWDDKVGIQQRLHPCGPWLIDIIGLHT